MNKDLANKIKEIEVYAGRLISKYENELRGPPAETVQHKFLLLLPTTQQVINHNLYIAISSVLPEDQMYQFDINNCFWSLRVCLDVIELSEYPDKN